VLFSFVEGETGPLTLKRVFALGQALAQFHVLAGSFKSSHQSLKLDLEFLLLEPIERIVGYLKDRYTHEQQSLLFLKDELLVKLSVLEREPSFSGILWGDGPV